MPTSSAADSPGLSRPLSVPLSSTRSWTSWSSVFFSSMTSRLPAGTSTLSGVNRMFFASTWTVVVSPVGVTPAEAAPAVTVVVAVGSMATPPATAMNTSATPAAADARTRRSSSLAAAARSSFVGRVFRWMSGFALALREARMPRMRNGRNMASPRATRPEHRTRTQLGTGSRQMARPRLMIVTRKAASRLSSRLAARTAVGPPPRTTGSK